MAKCMWGCGGGEVIKIIEYNNQLLGVWWVINPRRACAEGLRYLSSVCVFLCVCVSVCYHSSANIVCFYALNKIHRGLS